MMQAWPAFRLLEMRPIEMKSGGSTVKPPKVQFGLVPQFGDFTASGKRA